jgi:hypothetical protein
VCQISSIFQVDELRKGLKKGKKNPEDLALWNQWKVAGC